jgi:hypothetical protein
VGPLGGIGEWLRDMADDPSDFLDELRNMLNTGVRPRAILLSGGGNDVVKSELAALLNKAPSQEHINHERMDAKIKGELRGYYATILTEINRVSGGSVPVLVHPYCYPIPDGRFTSWWPESPLSWLYPYITTEMGRRKFEDGVPIMKQVIKKFEEMQQSLAKEFPNVTVVPSVNALDAFMWPAKYTDVWDNELHPNTRGFALIGKIFADTIARLP